MLQFIKTSFSFRLRIYKFFNNFNFFKSKLRYFIINFRMGFGVWGLGFGVWEIGRAHV